MLLGRRFGIALLVVLACGSPAPAPPPAPPAPTIDTFFNRPLPPLGTLTVVRVKGESAHRKLLAASLQGIVNQTQVRIFLVGTDDTPEEESAQRFWLAQYAAKNGVTVSTDEITLDAALARFAGETKGYVVASDAEPWTVAAATTIAGQKQTLIAEDDTTAALDALGLARVDDLRGRWATTDDATHDTLSSLYPNANPAALAFVFPYENRIRDFAIQNKLAVFYGEPLADGWNALEDVLGATPANIPVFGYVAKNPVEEVIGTSVISQAGKILVPSDTTPNLSVHASVPAPAPAATASAPGDCGNGTFRFTVAITDGDNLSVPLVRYASDKYWLSSQRGKVPMGWSLGGSFVRLVPAAAAYYASTRAPSDDLVMMIGIGYADPSQLPDPAPFLGATFDAMSAMKMTALWEIDPGLDSSTAALWDDMSTRGASSGVAGFLLGYFDQSQLVAWKTFRTSGGQAVVPAANDYSDTPADVQKKLAAALAAQQKGTGPDAMFVSAAVWNDDLAGLAPVISSFASQPGVTAMTPTRLLACLAKH